MQAGKELESFFSLSLSLSFLSRVTHMKPGSGGLSQGVLVV